ncbi:MAG TPA: hypothetical protein VIU62_00320, partial [Chloroflexota bacterium]
MAHHDGAAAALPDERLGAAFLEVGAAAGPREALEALLRSVGALFHADLAVAHLITSGAADRLTLVLARDGAPKPLPTLAATSFDGVLEWPAGDTVLIEDAAVLDPR